mmetsp:Transcript_7328/g.9093  ORF Transcript_7328/g.9093 Transcript_7328/m.9093 type:complete len:93 (-) Transcript_7328:14-292(-)
MSVYLMLRVEGMHLEMMDIGRVINSEAIVRDVEEDTVADLKAVAEDEDAAQDLEAVGTKAETGVLGPNSSQYITGVELWSTISGQIIIIITQ